VILDTNALSAAADHEEGINVALGEAHYIALPVIVLGEFRYGIVQSRLHPHYEKWLDELIPDCAVLDVTEATTLHYAAIFLELRKAGKPIPTNDVWIAALCRQHALPLLSRDRHFDFVRGLQRLEW